MTKPIIPLSKWPSWARFHANDSSGFGRFFSHKPGKDPKSTRWVRRSTNVRSQPSWFCTDGANWKDSVIRRHEVEGACIAGLCPIPHTAWPEGARYHSVGRDNVGKFSASIPVIDENGVLCVDDEFGLVISGFYGNGQLAMQSLQERPPQAYPNLDVKQRSLPTIPEEAWPDWANFHIIKSCGLGCWTAVQPVAFATKSPMGVMALCLLASMDQGRFGVIR